jgi:hypothetical protein
MIPLLKDWEQLVPSVPYPWMPAPVKQMNLNAAVCRGQKFKHWFRIQISAIKHPELRSQPAAWAGNLERTQEQLGLDSQLQFSPPAFHPLQSLLPGYDPARVLLPHWRPLSLLGIESLRNQMLNGE